MNGAPSSRSRTERLRATVLGRRDGPIRCRTLLRVGLDFGSDDPLTVVRGLVQSCGYEDEEAARRAMKLPPLPCMCRADERGRRSRVESMAPDDVLFQAMVLGLSTSFRYDPARPLLWTRTSLTRRLGLYRGEGFYA